MDNDSTDCRSRVEKLKRLRAQFPIRADLLLADLALAGLLDDLLDASTAALDLADRSTRVMYPLVRTAFEAAQRVVALATDDCYLQLGTRAWLYYQRKDATVIRMTEPEEASRWLEGAVRRMREIWTPHNDHAEALLNDAARQLDEHERKRPDNFVGRDLAQVVQERYPLLFGTLSDDVKQINRGIYAGLSRDSHARLRIEPAGFTIRADGTVNVIPRRPEEEAQRSILLHCLGASVDEAVGALSYLLAARRRQGVERLRDVASAASAFKNALPPGFRPDLGLRLAALGGAKTTFHFEHIPVSKLGILPDGTATWSANIVLDDGEYIAAFDVPRTLCGELAGAVGVPPSKLRPTGQLVKHLLDGSPTIAVECVLGDVQPGNGDTFVPLIVKRVAGTNFRQAD